MDRYYGDLLPFPPDTPERLTMMPIARLLGISRGGVDHLLRRGSLPVEIVRGMRTVRRDDLEAYVAARAKRRLSGGPPIAPRAAHTSTPPRRPRTPAVFTDGAARALTDLLASPPPNGRRWTLRSLAARLMESGAVEHTSAQGVSDALKRLGLSLPE